MRGGGTRGGWSGEIPLVRQLTMQSLKRTVWKRAISFKLTDQQLSLQDLARKFTQVEITPVAAIHDRTGEYPWAVLKKAWDVGLVCGVVL